MHTYVHTYLSSYHITHTQATVPSFPTHDPERAHHRSHHPKTTVACTDSMSRTLARPGVCMPQNQPGEIGRMPAPLAPSKSEIVIRISQKPALYQPQSPFKGTPSQRIPILSTLQGWGDQHLQQGFQGLHRGHALSTGVQALFGTLVLN